MKWVSFHALAERELNDAAVYYEQERAGLGMKFLDEVERIVSSIGRNPNAGKRVRGRVRRRISRKFLYGVLYSVNADDIRILAIMNLKRRPLYWVGRS
jgi:plasmid stabilization system protein ParE